MSPWQIQLKKKINEKSEEENKKDLSIVVPVNKF